MCLFLRYVVENAPSQMSLFSSTTRDLFFKEIGIALYSLHLLAETGIIDASYYDTCQLFSAFWFLACIQRPTHSAVILLFLVFGWQVFDSGLLGEGALHILAGARSNRLLTSGAAIVPSKARVRALLIDACFI